MKLKNNRLALAAFLILIQFVASCSHKKPAPNSLPATGQESPTPSEELAIPNDSKSETYSKANLHEYINTEVMPKIPHSKIVRDCFEASGLGEPKHVRFKFEARLVASKKQVNLKEMRLTSIENIPEPVIPCLTKAYEKFTFPPFKDSHFKSTSAFGAVDLDGNP